MHCLITGGTGLIGRALCAELLGEGHAVTVLTRSVEQAQRVLPANAKPVEHLNLVRNVDAIVNLAGENLSARRWTPRRKNLFRRSRLDATRALVRWIGTQPRKPEVLVSGSAIGFYGARDDEALDEDSGAGHDFGAGLCWDWETEALSAEALGVRVCRLRTGIVLAPDGGALAQMLPPFRYGLGGPLGNGRQWMSWIHRADLTALIRWLLVHESAGGPWNGTAPNPVRNRDFARALGRALHRPAFLPMPGFVLRPLVGEMAELLLTGQRVLPQRALAGGFRFRYETLEGALGDLVR